MGRGAMGLHPIRPVNSNAAPARAHGRPIDRFPQERWSN